MRCSRHAEPEVEPFRWSAAQPLAREQARQHYGCHTKHASKQCAPCTARLRLQREAVSTAVRVDQLTDAADPERPFSVEAVSMHVTES